MRREDFEKSNYEDTQPHNELAEKMQRRTPGLHSREQSPERDEIASSEKEVSGSKGRNNKCGSQGPGRGPNSHRRMCSS